MNILLIDNYDSFTYNLYQYIGEILSLKSRTFTLDVFRNDTITKHEIIQKKYDGIIISPGPGSPEDPRYFGVCADVLTEIGKSIPVLGVCLGMQGMAHYYGGHVVRAPLPMHGKTSIISHDGVGLFTNLPQHLEVMRYHSLIVDPQTLPSTLKISAHVGLKYTPNTSTVEIMGLRHTMYPIEGIQFHPESFATEGGKQMLNNFIHFCTTYEPTRHSAKTREYR